MARLATLELRRHLNRVGVDGLDRLLVIISVTGHGVIRAISRERYRRNARLAVVLAVLQQEFVGLLLELYAAHVALPGAIDRSSGARRRARIAACVRFVTGSRRLLAAGQRNH